jgi:hypothetical protein
VSTIKFEFTKVDDDITNYVVALRLYDYNNGLDAKTNVILFYEASLNKINQVSVLGSQNYPPDKRHFYVSVKDGFVFARWIKRRNMFLEEFPKSILDTM